jgi:hypothetical protein
MGTMPGADDFASKRRLDSSGELMLELALQFVGLSAPAHGRI